MEDITLKITIDEANLILESLGNLPFVKVYALIGKIQEQAGQQLADKRSPDDTTSGDNSVPTISE